MRVDELTIEVRNGSLARVGQILPSDMVGFEAVLRFNNVGAWKITLPSNHVMADALRAPGAGIIVTSEIGVILSGPTVAAKQTKTAADPIGVWEISGSDDSIILGERLAYPDPASAADAQTVDYDERTGPAETVIKAYVSANIGPSAPVARKISNLTIETDLGRGETVTGQARFDTLGPFIESLASTSGLGFTVEQNGSDLEFQIFAPTDRSAEIRMDVDNARLEKSEYTYTQPSVTRVVVAGPGNGTAREFLERTSTDSLAAETDWARRIEVFKDARGNSDADALALAGDELLTDGGYTVEAISVSPNDNQTMAYGIDWGLGDKVTVVVGDSEIVQIVTEVALVISTDGVKIGATVGNVKAAARQDVSARNTQQSQNQETRISNLERNEIKPEDLAAGTVQIQVKNSSGSTMTAGTVVYISSSNGVNFLISKAIATSDATSAQTLGVVQTDIANNEHGVVVTFGYVHGIDTSMIPEGSIAWLSSTTAGAITSTKQTAPAHLVYVGYCLKSNSGDGILFVKPQNGYELDELHDVAITSPAENSALSYNATTGLWEDRTPSVRAGQAFEVYDTDSLVGRVIGSANTLYIQGGYSSADTNGRIYIGRTASASNAAIIDLKADTINVGGNLVGTGIPFETAANTISLPSGTSAVNRTVTVTFPAGRFSQTPIVTTSCSSSSNLILTPLSITTSGFTANFRHADNAAYTTAQTGQYIAVQMTSSSGGG